MLMYISILMRAIVLFCSKEENFSHIHQNLLYNISEVRPKTDHIRVLFGECMTRHQRDQKILWRPHTTKRTTLNYRFPKDCLIFMKAKQNYNARTDVEYFYYHMLRKLLISQYWTSNTTGDLSKGSQYKFGTRHRIPYFWHNINYLCSRYKDLNVACEFKQLLLLVL